MDSRALKKATVAWKGFIVWTPHGSEPLPVRVVVTEDDVHVEACTIDRLGCESWSDEILGSDTDTEVLQLAIRELCGLTKKEVL